MPPYPKKEIKDSLQSCIIHQKKWMKWNVKLKYIKQRQKWKVAGLLFFFNATHRTSGTKDFSPGFRVVIFEKEALSKVQFLSHARQKKKKTIAHEISSSDTETRKKFENAHEHMQVLSHSCIHSWRNIWMFNIKLWHSSRLTLNMHMYICQDDKHIPLYKCIIICKCV